MAGIDPGRRAPSLAAAYLTIMALGLLVVLLAVSFMVFRFRADEQFQLAVADRNRVAASLFEVFYPLDPRARLDLAQELNFPSFDLEITAEPAFEPGQDERSQYLARNMRWMLGVAGHAASLDVLPEVRARLNDFSVHWSVFPYSTAARPGTPGNAENKTIFDATAAISLDQGQWLTFRFRHILRVDNNLLGLLLELLLLFFLIFFLSLIAIRLVTRPLRQLADYADRFAPDLSGRQPVRLPDKGPDEVLRASRAMQRMAGRIRHYVDERVRMLASISHDLRHPVHLIRLYLEKDSSHSHHAQLLEALDDLQRLADDAVTLARTGVNNEAARLTDVQALLASLVDDYNEQLALRQNADGGDLLRFHPLDREIVCLLGPLTFKRCVQNIVDNALRYGKTADIYLEAAGDGVAILVQDQGPGLPENLLEDVFQPFFRHDSWRGSGQGNGLGLSIARDLARQNNGEIVCRNLPQGGLEVRIILPEAGFPPEPAPASPNPCSR